MSAAGRPLTKPQRPAEIADLQGPAGVQPYAGKALSTCGLTRFLRTEAGFTPRIWEIAILVVTREMDRVQWTMHETAAREAGVELDLIVIIRQRKDTADLDENDAAVIALGREIYGDHKVTAQTLARAKGIFGRHRLVNLLLLMGNCASTDGLLIAVDMQLNADKKPMTLPIS